MTVNDVTIVIGCLLAACVLLWAAVVVRAGFVARRRGLSVWQWMLSVAVCPVLCVLLVQHVNGRLIGRRPAWWSWVMRIGIALLLLITAVGLDTSIRYCGPFQNFEASVYQGVLDVFGVSTSVSGSLIDVGNNTDFVYPTDLRVAWAVTIAGVLCGGLIVAGQPWAWLLTGLGAAVLGYIADVGRVVVMIWLCTIYGEQTNWTWFDSLAWLMPVVMVTVILAVVVFMVRVDAGGGPNDESAMLDPAE